MAPKLFMDNPTEKSHIDVIENVVDGINGSELNDPINEESYTLGDCLEYVVTEAPGEDSYSHWVKVHTDSIPDGVDSDSVMTIAHTDLIEEGYMFNTFRAEERMAHVMHTYWARRIIGDS